jgi:hypothetical protein
MVALPPPRESRARRGDYSALDKADWELRHKLRWRRWRVRYMRIVLGRPGEHGLLLPSSRRFLAGLEHTIKINTAARCAVIAED